MMVNLKKRKREGENICQLSVFGFQVLGSRKCKCNEVSLWNYVCVLFLRVQQ